MYKLVSENLSNLGGPMGTKYTGVFGGTEYTFDNWERFFSNIPDAKLAAEKDYGDKIDWIKESDSYVRSDDLGYVMYHIRQIRVE